MNVHILQHVPFETPGYVQDWIDERGHQAQIHRIFEQATLPGSQDVDMLVILGGPMSVNDTDNWLEDERSLIADMIRENKPVFGICLGAQQIAKVLGTEVFQGEMRETGWFPVEVISKRFSFLPETLTIFHWHGEQFGLPVGSEQLFATEVCPVQGFIYHGNVLGLQFHMEMKEANIQQLLEADGDYLDDSRYSQTAEEIEQFPIPSSNKEVLFQLLDELISPSK